MYVVADSEDELAMSQLIDEHGKDLFRLCCMCLRDTYLAEDAVQETFLRAFKGLKGFRGESSKRTWLVRIAVNVCRSMRGNAWFRHVDRRVALDELPLTVEGMPDGSITLLSEVMNLPRKEREAVWLYYYEDMKLREIAQVLGITTPAVSIRLSRARDRLRKALMEGEEGQHG